MCFFSVKMGNSLKQHQSAIRCFNGGTKKRKKDKKMFIWHAKKDLVFSMMFLQFLLLIVIAMKVELAFDPGSGPEYFKVMQNPSLGGGVSVHFTFRFCTFVNKKGLVPFPGDPVLSPGCVLVQHRQESSSSPAGHREQPWANYNWRGC